MTGYLSEAERYPWLTEAARLRLHWLHEHPSAPRFNHQCGDRLSAAGLARVRAYEQAVAAGPADWLPGETPQWVMGFAADCLRDVPFYREAGTLPAAFTDLPTCARADLSREPWAFVPDSLPLDDLIVYNTSGTTGHPLDILSHPEAASMYLPLLRAALGTRGVLLEGGLDASGLPRVSIVLVCFQRRSYTYASVSAYLGGAGFAKVNLNPTDWNAPEDRERYLDACDPEIYTGDPLSFAELARLPLTRRPKALISTAMQLAPWLGHELEKHFGCPVINLYAMNESGPIATETPGGFALLQPRLYVEILDPEGAPCPPGARGEVTLTGGFNPFLPLLRYRTGDWASVRFVGRQPLMADLEGRPPVIFRGTTGQAINNIDVTGALKPLGLPPYQLHQAADGALRLTLRDRAQAGAVEEALRGLYGPDQVIDVIAAGEPPGGKVVQYTREEA
jgi:phenylacetate-CoA ligase